MLAMTPSSKHNTSWLIHLLVRLDVLMCCNIHCQQWFDDSSPLGVQHLCSLTNVLVQCNTKYSTTSKVYHASKWRAVWLALNNDAVVVDTKYSVTNSHTTLSATEACQRHSTHQWCVHREARQKYLA